MFYTNLLEKVIFPLGDALLQTDFIKQLKYWRNNIDKKNSAELQQIQRERLQKLLKYSLDTIPFYKKQYIRLSGDPYTDIKQFPILYKQIIRDNIDDMYVGDKSQMIVEKSSGSSGLQGEVYMTRKENIGYQAVQTYVWEWGGYRLGQPLLQTGMTPVRNTIKKLKDYFLRTEYVRSFDLSEDQTLAHLLKAKNKGCKFFGGYASSLNVHAEAAIAAGLDIKFDGIISWGDKLFDGYKANINKAFNNPTIAEVYGTTEGLMIAGLCLHGNYHILTPHVYLELLDKDGNEVKAGELGYVVATRLDAFSFPLIRYYLGDLAIKESEDVQCPCGRHFPLLKKIVGRDTDIVHSPAGKALIVHFFTYIFEHEPTIHQFRVLQKVKGEIQIEYIPGKDFSPEVLDKIAKAISQKANETIPVTFAEVREIPNTPSGKPQLVLNTIAKKLV